MSNGNSILFEKKKKKTKRKKQDRGVNALLKKRAESTEKAKTLSFSRGPRASEKKTNKSVAARSTRRGARANACPYAVHRLRVRESSVETKP